MKVTESCEWEAFLLCNLKSIWVDDKPTKEQAMARGGKHPGFRAVQSKIAARMGVSKQRAGAILASATRKASSSAKKKNPRLKRVKG
jgi:hypothetical protein